VSWRFALRSGPHRVRREIGLATLYLGDCREVLPYLDGVCAVVADPPYGIGLSTRTRSTGTNDHRRGKKESFRTDFAAVAGDSKPFDPSPLLKWPCILWGAHNYAAALPASNGWLVWHKTGGIRGFNMSECEMAWTNFLGSTKHISHMWHGYKRDSEIGERVQHPTQKPVAVMDWCVGFTDAPVIVDPYMGSGSTGIAALKAGRRFIGCEIDPTHFATACKRIEDAQRQGRLFASEAA
jgi:site-specific DNA-methyltransferase (adenine-specific)